MKFRKNSPAAIFLILFGVLSVVSFMVGVQFGTAQNSTNVTGIISSDTTWTKTNSPYTLTGPIRVNNGVTLTVEAGATVNLNNYYIQVDGTLVARGSSNDKIHVTDGSISFTAVSNSWNEQTGSGSIIEYSVLSNASVSISNVSPKINRNSIYGVTINGGSPAVLKRCPHFFNCSKKQQCEQVKLKDSNGSTSTLKDEPSP